MARKSKARNVCVRRKGGGGQKAKIMANGRFRFVKGSCTPR